MSKYLALGNAAQMQQMLPLVVLQNHAFSD